MGIDPGPLAAVQYVATGDGWTLIFTRDLKHPPEKVWAALTVPAEVGEWAPFVTEHDLGTVGDKTLTMIDGDTRVDMPATVTLAEPPTVLEYIWGTDLLRWELVPSASGTRLTLRHTVAELDLIPKVAAGWHLCLVVAERLMDGRPVGPIRGQAAMNYGWEALHDAYAARMVGERR
jgi:uncharacterized protein YndB with AHSA1/START domain